MPVASPARSGGKSSHSRASVSAPSVCRATKPSSARPSAKITFMIESSSQASVSGREVGGRAEAVEGALYPQCVAVAERAGIAHVPGDAVRAAGADHAPQARGDVPHRLVPRGALELAGPARALERVQHPIRIVLDAGHGDALGAGVTA